MGGFPSPEGNHRLGTTHTFHMKSSASQSERHDLTKLPCDFLFSILLNSQIIKKSCIEILAAEPSSVCAGGKRCEEPGPPPHPFAPAVWGYAIVSDDSHPKPLEWNRGLE